MVQLLRFAVTLYGGGGGFSFFIFYFLSSFGSGVRDHDAVSYLYSRYHGECSTEGSVDRLSWFESVYSVMHTLFTPCDGAPARPFTSRFRWSAALIRVLGMVRALSTGRGLGLLRGIMLVPTSGQSSVDQRKGWRVENSEW